MKQIYDLSGTWQFEMDVEQDKSIQQVTFHDIISLPSTTAMAQKGPYNYKRETGYLTELYPFEGNAWYQKNVTIAFEDIGCPIYLFLERTRLTTLWINGQQVGSRDSICTSHRYDITDYVKEQDVQITICVDNKNYPIKGGHMTSPDTQTNWNGILGQIELQVYHPCDIRSVITWPNLESQTVTLELNVDNRTESPHSDLLQIEGYYCFLENDSIIEEEICIDNKAIPLTFEKEVSVHKISIPIQNIKPFSEFTPGYYRLQLRLSSNEKDMGKEVIFGFRNFTTDTRHFYINGTATFLRGKQDGLIFPLTGAAPMEVSEWLRVMGIAKSYGINHYRYHTCCPPKAAFIAADLLGIYMAPELPFWGTIADIGEDGYNETEQNYLIQEGYRIMEAYGGHPSFVMMSLGNELWGSTKRLSSILQEYEAVDRRHLYTMGSNNFQFYPTILPEDDFFVGVRFDRDSLIRGSYAMCDAPQGFIQTISPTTNHDYDRFFEHQNQIDLIEDSIEIQYETGVKKVRVTDTNSFIPEKPVVSHEIGQYCMYPDFKEIDKYTGVLQARNYQVFQERLISAGMLDQADRFFQDSGKLAAFCYKLELEAAHRSKHLAGYQILDIQDFTGQGTALVGILNAFMESKGVISNETWKGFCNETVLLASFSKFVWKSGETFDCQVMVSHYGPKPLKDRIIDVTLATAKEQKQWSYEINQKENGVITVGSFSHTLTSIEQPTKAILTLSLCGTDIQNQYELYLYPNVADHAFLTACEQLHSNSEVVISKNNRQLHLTTDLLQAIKLLKRKKRVLFLPKTINGIPGSFCTDFWCYPMFRSISESMNRPVPIGTLGCTIQNNHKALNDYPCNTHTTPDLYHLITHSTCSILDRTNIKPIIQVIDNFERNHKLGLLYEAQVGDGKLLVCTSKLFDIMEHAEIRQFAMSIMNYGLSEDFKPEVKVSPVDLINLF